MTECQQILIESQYNLNKDSTELHRVKGRRVVFSLCPVKVTEIQQIETRVIADSRVGSNGGDLLKTPGSRTVHTRFISTNLPPVARSHQFTRETTVRKTDEPLSSQQKDERRHKKQKTSGVVTLAAA